MWDLPGPGLEPVSLALAGEFLTTAPPGKSLKSMFKLVFKNVQNFSMVQNDVISVLILVLVESFFSGT